MLKEVPYYIIRESNNKRYRRKSKVLKKHKMKKALTQFMLYKNK